MSCLLWGAVRSELFCIAQPEYCPPFELTLYEVQLPLARYGYERAAVGFTRLLGIRLAGQLRYRLKAVCVEDRTPVVHVLHDKLCCTMRASTASLKRTWSTLTLMDTSYQN